ncbi:MAG: ATP-binding protein, partial [Gammaproteobacteria bacterium]|nr:ATP-binding protein [Gammaproteobacteria bacterium]
MVMRFSTFKRKQRINKYQIVKAFAGLLVNKTSLDDLLWGLTEAIGKLLYFPDCVIYLREGDEFVQKAATGLKNPDRRQIKNPLRLRLGQGIVGSVAKSGVPERIPDVTKDPRYVYDEAPAQSELTVPIIYDDEVIAIFDCESTERNFFSDADLDLFEVLANLMGPRIGLALEEQRRDKAEKELRAAKNAAEAANEAKSQFLANISHELRTPMTPIISYTELLINAEQSNSTPPVSESEALQAIQRNSELLLRLIDDVLDVAKIEAGELDVHISEFNLADLLDHIVTHQRIQAQVKNLELTVNYADNAPKIIYSDPLRVQQIVTNLIANAIKFTAAGGVKVNVDSPAAGTMRVQVIDTGIGISEKELNGLFQPFTQVDPSSTRKYGGAGLGLFISRE